MSCPFILSSSAYDILSKGLRLGLRLRVKVRARARARARVRVGLGCRAENNRSRYKTLNTIRHETKRQRQDVTRSRQDDKIRQGKVNRREETR
jgi:hypothetical protein